MVQLWLGCRGFYSVRYGYAYLTQAEKYDSYTS